MIVGCYSEFLRITRGTKESTIRHYIQGLNAINKLLVDSGLPVINVFEISSATDLIAIKQFLDGNEEYIRKNKVGNNMYSAALNHFINFANDEAYFNSFRITKLDAPILIEPKTKTFGSSLLFEQAIRAENYTCSVNRVHESFIDATTSQRHMDGHYLVPISYQQYFPVSLRVYANIVSLCPICKSKIHFGKCHDRAEMLEGLYDIRSKRLKTAGIHVTLENVLEFNQCVGEKL